MSPAERHPSHVPTPARSGRDEDFRSAYPRSLRMPLWAMTVRFRITDGPPTAPWLSPDIEPGQVAAGSFTAVPTLTTGKAYDFRLRVWNDGTEDAAPWTDSAATGDFVPPVNGTAGLAWPLTGAARTIASSGVTNVRVQLIPQGGHYGLELQTSAGVHLADLASTL